MQVNTVHYYKGYWDCNCECNLQINNNVVIVTESENNKGTSITNMVEGLFENIVKDYNLDATKVLWFEIYNVGNKKQCSQVEFDINIENNKTEARNPVWTSISYEDLMKIFNKE